MSGRPALRRSDVRLSALRFVTIGSSTSAGKNLPTGDDSDRSGNFVNQFLTLLCGQRPGSTAVNLSVPGYNTNMLVPTGMSAAAAANITAALTYSPGVILVCTPKDILQTSQATMLANYDAIVSAAGGVQVWFSSATPTDTGSAQDITNLRTQNTLTSASYLSYDLWTPLANPDGTFKTGTVLPDGVHPNLTGQALCAQALASIRSAPFTDPAALAVKQLGNARRPSALY